MAHENIQKTEQALPERGTDAGHDSAKTNVNSPVMPSGAYVLGDAGLNGRQQALLSLQRTVGNAATLRALARTMPTVQRQPHSGVPAVPPPPAPPQSADPVNWQNARLGKLINDANQSIERVAQFIGGLGEGAFNAVRELQDAQMPYLLNFAISHNARDQERYQRCNDVLHQVGMPGPVMDGYIWQDAMLGIRIQTASVSISSIVSYINGLAPAAQTIALADLQQAHATYLGQNLKIHLGDERLRDVQMNLGRSVAQTQAPGVTAPEGGWKNKPPASLLAGTSAPTEQQQTAIRDGLVPPIAVAPGTNTPLSFMPIINGQDYGARIEHGLLNWITEQTASLVTGKGPSEHQTNVFSTQQYVDVARAAKEEAVDPVFGSYARGPAFQWNVNLRDQFDDQQQAQAHMSAAQKREVARELLQYAMNDETIRAINHEHNAAPNLDHPQHHPTETRTVSGIIKRLAPAHLQELLDIERGWPGEQNPRTHVVTLQRFRSNDPDQRIRNLEDRRVLWDNFQTMIHEYCHALTHSRYQHFAERSGSEQYNTLIEGMTSVMTETAWTQVEARLTDPALRQSVEGLALSQAPFDPATVPRISGQRYPSYEQAMNIVNIVGRPNVYAAYFLGRVDLIRAASPRRRP